MNKYQEALKKLRKIEQTENTWDENCEVLQELVDKATPKEPIIESQDYGYSYCYCPMCDANVGIETHLYTHNKYCHYCGQALDWGTDDE